MINGRRIISIPCLSLLLTTSGIVLVGGCRESRKEAEVKTVSSEVSTDRWMRPLSNTNYYDSWLREMRVRHKQIATSPVVYVPNAARKEVVSFRKGMTVANAIAESGGFKQGEAVAVRLLRRSGDVDSMAILSLYLAGTESFGLKPNDIVTSWVSRSRTESRTDYDDLLQAVRARQEELEGDVVYVAAAGKTGRAIKFSRGMTLGQVLDRWGSSDWRLALTITVARREVAADSFVNFPILSGEEWQDWRSFALQQGDIVIYTKESL